MTKLPDPAAQVELVERAVVDKLTRQEVIEAVRERKAGVVRGAPSPQQGTQVYRVGETVTVTVRYRKGQRLTPVQALRIALKQAQAAERAQADNPDHEEKVA